ncbi:tigger transposable element-derived protein 6-like [Ornithodoros turicata]|uniref:tigger transposable element-derived protein 6-like n=1 Tax=Ornithodoros turicata TaxID=34597 RepID=UPI003138767D
MNAILDWFHRERGIRIVKSTLSVILKESDAWLQVSSADASSMRKTSLELEALERSLVLWVESMTERKAVVSDMMLVEKARFLGPLQDYSPEDIYNIDETALFYRLGPTRTLAANPVSGTKRSKARLTVGLLCNASGTDKCKPVVIAKAMRPRDFGKKFSPEIYCHYHANGKAWMTSDIFVDTLRQFNRRLQREKRQAILLVDNAGCHKLRSDTFTNLRVEYLPANSTSKIQPLDAGIIRAAKVAYQRELMRHYIALAEAGEEQTVGVRWCIRTFSRVWASVSESTTRNCWRHTGILPSAACDDDGNDDGSFSDDDLPLAELERQMRILDPSLPDSAAEECISYTDGDDICEPLNDDTLARLSGTVNTDSEHSDNEEHQPGGGEPVTAGSAWNHIESAIRYFEDRVDESSVRLLSSLLNRIDPAESQKLMDQ